MSGQTIPSSWPGADQVAQEVVVEVALLDDHLPPLAAQRAEVLEEDAHLHEVLGVVGEVDDDEGADLLQRVPLERPVRSRFFSASSWTPWMIS